MGVYLQILIMALFVLFSLSIFAFELGSCWKKNMAGIEESERTIVRNSTYI